MTVSIFKKILLVAVIVFTGQWAISQTADIKILYTDSANLTLNDITFEKELAIETVLESIGKASRVEDFPSGETGYYYDDQGLIIIAVDGSVMGMAVNFNWNGDEKLPEKTFTGELFLDNLKINVDTKSEDIEGIRNDQFDCPIPKMCATFDKMSSTPCIAFFDEDLITSVTFLIK